MIDDFGDEVNRCRYTEKFLWPDDAKIIGATVPGVKARYAISARPEVLATHKAQGVAFHESEANCNTCRALVRIPLPKALDGLHVGCCSSQNGRPQDGPYANRTMGDITVFHPDDPMHMPCYESRWSATTPASGKVGEKT